MKKEKVRESERNPDVTTGCSFALKIHKRCDKEEK
jgi:hypothetical protein